METYCFLKYYSFSSGVTIYCDWYHLPWISNFRGGFYSGGESRRTQNYRSMINESRLVRSFYDSHTFFLIFFCNRYKMESWEIVAFYIFVFIVFVVIFVAIFVFKAKFLALRFKAAKKIASS